MTSTAAPGLIVLPPVPPVENIRAHGLEFLTSVAAIIIGITFFVDPNSVDRTPIGQAVHPLDWAWNVMYIVGGILVVIGLPVDHRKIAKSVLGANLELAGLALLIPAYFAEVLTNLTIGHVTTFGVIIRAAITLGLCNRAWCMIARRKSYIPIAVCAPSRH